MENIGVFLCTGCEIGAAINVDELESLAGEEGAKTFAKHECLCSAEGVALIQKAVEDGTDGVVIAACSHRVKVDEFKFDPMKVSVERMCLREQVAWSHPHGEEDTQMLAADLMRMSVARIQKNTLNTALEETVDRTVLVVGGGVAGLNAALGAAQLGNPVVLLELSDKLGGYMAGVKDAIPERPPYNTLAKNEIAELVKSVEGNDSIKVILSSKLKSIDGQPGQFEVELESPASTQPFMVGSIIQATGSRPYNVSGLTDLGFGVSPDVVTSADLEKMITAGEMKRPSDGKVPARITFIQCAGSRNADHLPYCSSECCATTLRHVNAIKRDFPSVQCAVVYRDMRTPGQMEHFYLATQEQTGCLFTRGENTTVEAGSNGNPVVKFDNKLLGEESELESDMVVLAVGMTPNSADSESIRQLIDAKGRILKNESETQVKQATELVEKLTDHEGTEILHLNYRQGPDLPVLRYNFPDSHYICFPYETRRTGIYAAGTLRAPMDAAQAAEDGWGAAMKAVQCIYSAENGQAVHPRAGDVSFAEFSLQRCTQCKRCTEECPFGAINEDEKGTPQYNPLRCRRCGTCLGACPERIINFPEYTVGGVGSMVKAMEIPEEEDEKPRILAFMCENDAIPALDEAAARRMQWNPWIRIIPVRCLGAVNVIWIADAMSNGIDGVLLLGCKKGDDYQCHYMTGSELANKRMENVSETLDRLSLESERVRIIEIARNEFERIPQIFEEFAEKIDELGPNPMKGF